MDGNISQEHNTFIVHINGLVQNCGNSSAKALELP